MKKNLLLVLFLIVSAYSFAQKGYEKVYAYNKYNKDWAMVKTNSGTYGFIDRKGKAVVLPIYTKIEKFGTYDTDLALVRNISGGYGFIDRNGKEVIQAIHELEYIKTNFKTLKQRSLR
ncbi:WG repeat-containing protein [Pedobacter nototheniae]|uniref:WG repeat-containing protein n=1 Tax=Pedobacter nototheniae TaxID=2488994 RepID=UPI002931322C|nr:WG repeat-containing protein [Pedobacter nototheniae]